MPKSIVDHAENLIKKDGPTTLHHIAATFFIAGGKFDMLDRRHPDVIAKEHLAKDDRFVQYPNNHWDLA